MQSNADRTTEFLSELYGDIVGPGMEIVPWSQKRSVWCATIEQAVATTHFLDETADTYHHVALHDRDRAMQEAVAKAKKENVAPPSRIEDTRGSSASARAIGGLWVDGDVKGDKHAKDDLPENIDIIIATMHAMPVKPTWIIKTGGGVHGWWFMKEPWRFETKEEWMQARRLSKGWQAHFRKLLRHDLDSTHDLARLMRLPGTRSHKHGCMLEVLEHNTYRSNPSDLEQFEVDASEVERAAIAMGSFVIRHDAVPPFDKLQMLINYSAEFAQTWGRKRQFKSGKNSQSEYDLSLASFCAHAKWSDQEIVDTIIAHRRLGSDKEKLRPDYFVRTLGRARAEQKGDDAIAHLADSQTPTTSAPENAHASQEAVPALKDMPGPTSARANGAPLDADVRAAALADISRVIGSPVVGVIKWLKDPAEFELVLTSGNITIGGAVVIIDPKKFQVIVASSTGKVIRDFKRAAWRPVAQALFDVAEPRDLGPDSDVAKLCEEWMRSYLAGFPPSTAEENITGAILKRKPFVKAGAVHMFLEPFVSWARSRGAADKTFDRFNGARMMTIVGCTRTSVNFYRVPDDLSTRTSVRVWRLPIAIFAIPDVLPEVLN